ncbi:MAG: hypothetical protein WCQ49_02480 [Candidatus Saccharibacteria bacterium]
MGFLTTNDFEKCEITRLEKKIKKVTNPSDDKYANINMANMPTGPAQDGEVTFSKTNNKQRLKIVVMISVFFNITNCNYII